MAVVPMFAKLLDPSFLPSKMTLGDKLFRLGVVSPQDYRDIERLVDLKLKKRWPDRRPELR